MTVEWQEHALDRLADIYVAVSPGERDGIVRCVEQTNARLAVDPMHLGESRGPNRRVWFNHPLPVVYDLIPGGGVLVIHVARLKGNPLDG
jgi:hypothetical protein